MALSSAAEFVSKYGGFDVGTKRGHKLQMNGRVLVLSALFVLTALATAGAQAPAAQNRAAIEKQIVTMERAINDYSEG